jgi:hypothetical protein
MRWAVAVLLVLSLAGTVFFARNPVASGAQDYAQTVAGTAAATYLSLRAVNAFLSMAEEVEVGGSMVVSGTAKPLKWLEPIDDTVERIAGAVFAVMVISGLVSIALGPVGAVGCALIAASCALWLLPVPQVTALVRRLGVYGVFLAVALPCGFWLSEALSGVMTETVRLQNEAAIDRLTAGVGAARVEPDNALIPDVIENLDRYRVLAGALYENADQLIASYIQVLAVYLFNLLVLPALLVGGFLIVARWAATER